jgi:hypothetical protein
MIGVWLNSFIRLMWKVLLWQYYAKKIIFFPILGGSAPVMYLKIYVSPKMLWSCRQDVDRLHMRNIVDNLFSTDKITSTYVLRSFVFNLWNLLASLRNVDYSITMLYSSILFFIFNYHAISLSLFIFHTALKSFSFGVEFGPTKHLFQHTIPHLRSLKM